MSGFQGTETSIGKMTTVASNVEEVVSNYRASIERLYEIAARIDAMWVGDASQKFMTILGNDRAKFDALTIMLGEYISALRINANTYINAEDEVMQILNQSQP